MKAIALFPEKLSLECIDVPEPTIQAADEVKLQVLQVGVCGTDREEASGLCVYYFVYGYSSVGVASARKFC